MPAKVVIVKPGLDSHYRGALVVSRYLVSRGMEVVYAGNQTPQGCALTVVQEDADVLGISSLSGNHLLTVPAIIRQLRAAGRQDVLVVVGGVIPDRDCPVLIQMGVTAVFGPGTALSEIADLIEQALAGRNAAEGGTP